MSAITIDWSNVVSAEAKRTKERAALVAVLARIRWQFETGGLVLPDGTQIRTDRETRASITEAINSLNSGLMTEPGTWKMANGWAELTGDTLAAIAGAVGAHVKASFAAERRVSEQIEALPDVAGFDLQAAFYAGVAGQGGQP